MASSYELRYPAISYRSSPLMRRSLLRSVYRSPVGLSVTARLFLSPNERLAIIVLLQEAITAKGPIGRNTILCEAIDRLLPPVIISWRQERVLKNIRQGYPILGRYKQSLAALERKGLIRQGPSGWELTSRGKIVPP